MALTEIYVDPFINANSGTGTIGDPYGDLQYALNTVSRDATNGNRFNVKAGTAEVLTAAISLTTYGTPTAAAPCWFEGYTSAAEDGGRGEITGNGSYGIFASNGVGFTRWKNLKLGNCGANFILYPGTNTLVDSCELHTNNNHGLPMLGASSMLIDSWVHGTRGSYAVNCPFVIGCFIEDGTTTAPAIDTGVTYAIGNLISGFKFGINVNQGLGVFGNTIVGTNAASGHGISLSFYSQASNNLITGYSGSGARGITTAGLHGQVIANNAFWNCATNIGGGGTNLIRGSVSLGSDPFVDAAGGDYSTTEAALLAAMPSLLRGSSTTNAAYIGAAQTVSSGGGGIQIARGMHGGMR